MDDELRKQVDELHAYNKEGPKDGCYIRWACFVDGKIKKMASRPCYGEMRAYGQKSTRPQDSKPGDLPNPMPIGGKRGPLALYFYDQTVDDDFIRRVFDPVTSPWRRGIAEDVEFTVRGDKIVGVVFPTPSVDPTVMLSLFINSRGFKAIANAYKLIPAVLPGLSEEEVLFLAFFFRPNTSGGWNGQPLAIIGCNLYHSASYSLNGNVDLKRWFFGESDDLSNGRTWLDGEDYNRPSLADVFVGKDGTSFMKWAQGFITPIVGKTTPDDYTTVVKAFHERYQKEFAK